MRRKRGDSTVSLALPHGPRQPRSARTQRRTPWGRDPQGQAEKILQMHGSQTWPAEQFWFRINLLGCPPRWSEAGLNLPSEAAPSKPCCPKETPQVFSPFHLFSLS